MWSKLPADLLAEVFSFLPPVCLVRASLACRQWRTSVRSYVTGRGSSEDRSKAAWLVALPVRNHRQHCYAHNPINDKWCGFCLDFIPGAIRPVAPAGGLLLYRLAHGSPLQLGICNLFTRQDRHLPMLSIRRTNPAVGLVMSCPTPQSPYPAFRIYVAGGMSEAPLGGATYDCTLEMYESRIDKWQIVGRMPIEFAVRLTVWTPNESVYSDGVLYWMTSARAYSIMGLDIGSNTWTELNVPLADRLEFAALVQRNGKLTLVGGTTAGGACIWQLNDRDDWVSIDKVPVELGKRLLGGQENWGNVKCVGCDGVVCLYRDLWSGMVLWRQNADERNWEWRWIEGCFTTTGKQVENCHIRGVILHPSLALAPSIFLTK